MKWILCALAAALSLLAPSKLWADARVLNADCTAFSQGLNSLQMLPVFARKDGQPACVSRPLEPSFVEANANLFVTVYTKAEINELLNNAADQEDKTLKSLKQALQGTLEDAVFKAAIQGDQIDRIEDEVWKRVAVKYRREIGEMETSLAALREQAEEIRKSTEALQAKLQSLQPATPAPASSPAPGQP